MLEWCHVSTQSKARSPAVREAALSVDTFLSDRWQCFPFNGGQFDVKFFEVPSEDKQANMVSQSGWGDIGQPLNRLDHVPRDANWLKCKCDK